MDGSPVLIVGFVGLSFYCMSVKRLILWWTR
jgi:hypothetical protein